jgi:hypothetical protein
LADSEYWIGLTKIGYNNKIRAAQASENQLLVTCKIKANTGTITINFSTFSSVFSGTVIFFAASSNSAMRSVNGLSANAGIFLVEV